MRFEIPMYMENGIQTYDLADIKLSLGNTQYQEFKVWIATHVPESRRLKEGVAVTDVERFLNRRRTALI